MVKEDKAWEKQELDVLVRNKPEEAVLVACISCRKPKSKTGFIDPLNISSDSGRSFRREPGEVKIFRDTAGGEGFPDRLFSWPCDGS
jgi:hypothetical protein